MNEENLESGEETPIPAPSGLPRSNVNMPKHVVNEAYTTMPYIENITASSFQRFYPFYLGQHANRTNRRLHLIGTSCVLGFLLAALVRLSLKPLLVAPLVGYGPAWIGHFIFERNRPATFRHPLFSLMGDFKLWTEVVSGRRSF